MVIFHGYVSLPEGIWLVVWNMNLIVHNTSASVKSYQLVKVVSGGRAPGKSSSLASPQLLAIERFHCFGAVRLEKVQFVYCVDF